MRGSICLRILATLAKLFCDAKFYCEKLSSIYLIDLTSQSLNVVGGRTTFHNYERNELSTLGMGLVKGMVKSPSRKFSIGNHAQGLKGKCMDGGGIHSIEGRRPTHVGDKGLR
jgi:hypothetical protein